MGVEVRSHRGPEKEVMEYPVERVDISKLVPHEQTINKELQWFIENVQEDGSVRWPLLIGKGSYIILDGHHRAAGLTHLDYDYVPAILIEYSDDELIKLGTWYPNIEQPIAKVIEKLKETDLKISDAPTFDQQKLQNREVMAFIGSNDTIYQVQGEREMMFKVLRDNWINNITYYDDAELCLDNADSSHTAVIAWSYTKDEIKNHVKEGIVHLPKTTRHILKYRVPEVNYKLGNLKDK